MGRVAREQNMNLADITTDLVKEVQNREKGNFLNNILYEMCENYPCHTDRDEINGKLMIIGRTYAAALERTRTIYRMPGYDVYDETSEKIINDSLLDGKIGELKKTNSINRSLLPKILETHKYVMDLFAEKTGQNKRSLASKYLHFHARELFFIYDSRAASEIRGIIKAEKLSEYPIDEKACDIEYAQFYVKLFKLQVHIKEKFNIYMTPREIDRMLLGY
jgi:hypothetical protein